MSDPKTDAAIAHIDEEIKALVADDKIPLASTKPTIIPSSPATAAAPTPKLSAVAMPPQAIKHEQVSREPQNWRTRQAARIAAREAMAKAKPAKDA